MESMLRREAVERAYRDHVDDVYRVVYAVIRDREQARDLTQDVFARAFERWEQYDDRRPVRPWLQAIGAHVALDAMRRRRVRWLVLPGGAPSRAGGPRGDQPGNGVDPEPMTADPTDRALDRDLLETALAGLRPVARAAVVLRHVYGYEYAEIASMLGTSPGNVGSLLTRSHAALRERLAADHPSRHPNADPARRAAR